MMSLHQRKVGIIDHVTHKTGGLLWQYLDAQARICVSGIRKMFTMSSVKIAAQRLNFGKMINLINVRIVVKPSPTRVSQQPLSKKMLRRVNNRTVITLRSTMRGCKVLMMCYT